MTTRTTSGTGDLILAMATRLKNFIGDESGSSAVEYALMIGIVSLGIIGSVESLPAALAAIFGNVVTALTP